MTKKIKQQTPIALNETNALQEKYTNELATNPEFSLDADPTGELKLSDFEKQFISLYIDYRDIAKVADLLLVSVEEAKDLLIQYKIRNEIRRINRAIYHHQFNRQLISMNNIEGYLSSLLTDDCVPEADRLKPLEKLKVIDELLKVNELKMIGMANPKTLIDKDLDVQIRALSITTIKTLLAASGKLKENSKLINQIDDDNLTAEEKAYLSTLPTNELLELIDKTDGGEK